MAQAITRRHFIGTAAAASAAAGVHARESTAQIRSTRNHPLDGITRENITITDVRVRLFSTPIPPEKWWYGCGVTILTEVFTDTGIVGIGGPSPYGGPEPVKEYTEQYIRPALIGQNPFDVEFITAGGPAYIVPSILNPNFVESCAWAGVNIACWDIIGKALGVPVYELFAIDHDPDPHVEHYASAGTLHDWAKGTQDRLIDEVLGYQAEGFKSCKFRLGENFEDVMTIPSYVPFLEKLRDAVGPDFGLMHENNMRLSVAQCLELVPVLEELGFIWLEEPISRWGSDPAQRGTIEGVKDAIDGHVRIAETAKTLLISGGETMQQRQEFREWIDRGAYDIVQPDCDTTGLTEGWYIARMAHLKNKPCVPHNWHGGLTWMSNIQLVAGIPNQLVLESDRHYNPFREELFKEPIVVNNSYADAPNRPGLGVEIINDADRKFPYDPKNDWRNISR